MLPLETSPRKHTVPKPTIDWSHPESALASLGGYIDACFQVLDRGGSREALNIIHQGNTKDWPAELRGQLQYFESNAWADLRDPKWDAGGAELPWDGEEVENQILALRRSILLGSQTTESPVWLPMAWTNLGNVLDHVGRPVEAIEAWTEALAIKPQHAMARGNRGIGLANYGRNIADSGHRVLFFAAAHQDLTEALKAQQALEPEARGVFTKVLEFLGQSMTSPANLLKVPDLSLGDSAQERDYRRWCLDRRLFLNPLNDIDSWAIAAKDTLTLPTLTAKDFQPEEWIALFNQIKQEFVSARYLVYDGLTSHEPHFSDRDVLLLNPMDYSTYSLASEKVKAGYRMAYSVFDKIAYLLNDYLELAQPERRISLRTVWYAEGKPAAGLHAKFRGRRNHALRGLYWLSKDLHEERPGFRDALLPDARELVEIRRHAEHKLLRLQDPVGIAVTAARTFPEPQRRRRLGYPLPYDVFKLRVTRLLKTARSGIMYLSFVIGEEENKKSHTRGPRTPAFPMVTDIFEDRWKRPPT